MNKSLYSIGNIKNKVNILYQSEYHSLSDSDFDSDMSKNERCECFLTGKVNDENNPKTLLWRCARRFLGDRTLKYARLFVFCFKLTGCVQGRIEKAYDEYLPSVYKQEN
jgi:hypothetical protein